jgi:hypothetical protein
LSRAFSFLTSAFLVFLALAILGGMVWGNALYARQHQDEKDFLVPWLAARTFLDYGDSPYSHPATQRAQIVYYGRIAEDGEDLLILWLSFPAELFYFPIALIPNYALARGLWMTLSEAALVASAFIALRLTGWKPSRFLLPLALLFPVLWIFGFMNLLASSPVPFVVLASVGALLALRSGQDEVAGALLVVLLLKIGIFGIFLLFVLWWSIYHRRWRVLAGLVMALGILLLLSFLLLPDWIMPFVRGLYWHTIHNPGLSFYRILGSIWPVVGPRLGWVLTAFLLVMLFVEWREVCYRDFRHTLWTVCLTLAITPLLGFPLAVNDFAILVLPLFLIATILGERWPGRRLRGPAGIVLVAAWIALWGLAQAPGLAPLLPILLVIGLYWIKWWAVRPPRTALEILP